MGNDAGTRGRGRPRNPEIDAAILRAALDSFIDGGVEGTSIEQIAKRAGVGKLTVYRRWASKEDLLVQAIESIRDRMPDPSAADLADTPVAELIARTLPAASEAIADARFRALVARVFAASASHPSLMETYWRHYVMPRRHAAQILVDRAKQEGILNQETDPDVLVDMMVGAVLYRAIQPGHLDPAQARRYLQSVYRQAGLLPSPHQ